MDVGIRELKAKLSEYIERAASGEVIRVTDRGVPRAVLMGLPVTDRIKQGVEEGWIRPPTATGLTKFTPVAVRGGPTTSEIIAKDRGD